MTGSGGSSRTIFDFDSAAIRWRRGAWATATAVLAIVAVLVVNVHSIWAGVAALAAGLVYFDAPLSQRLWFIVILTVLGAGVVGSAIAFSGPVVADAVVLAALTAVITVVQSLGGPFLAAGFLVGFVAFNATVAAEVGTHDAASAVVSYLIGGAVAMVVISMLDRLGHVPDPDVPVAGAISPLVGDEILDGQPGIFDGLAAKLVGRLTPTSRAFRFGLVRGLAVGAAVALGQSLLHESWVWMAVPAFVLLVPVWELAWSSTLKRLAGNLLGVGVFSVLTLVSDARAFRLAVLLAAAFFAFSFFGTGTASVTATWTVVAFGMAWVVDEEFDLYEITGERILATLAGATIALGAVLLLQRIVRPGATSGGSPST